MYSNLLLLMKKYIIRNVSLHIEELLNFYNYYAKTIIFKVKTSSDNNQEKSDKLTSLMLLLNSLETYSL